MINPSLYSKLPFNVERDFAPITLAAMTPSVLATHPSLPKDIIARVNSVAAALKTADTRERYIALGAEPFTNTPEQYAAFIRKDIQDWAKVVKVSGARLD